MLSIFVSKFSKFGLVTNYTGIIRIQKDLVPMDAKFGKSYRSSLYILHTLCFYNKLYFYVLSIEKRFVFCNTNERRIVHVMKVSKSSCAYLLYSEINTIFYIFHSVHYNSVFVIPTNKCTVPVHLQHIQTQLHFTV